MAKKITFNRQSIISDYMTDYLEGSDSLASVYAFCKNHKMEEKDFYDYFSSFENLEKSILAEFANKTIELLIADQNYKQYDSKEKLLSFYYTFFEILSQNRSFVLKMIDGKLHLPKTHAKLTKLRQAYIQYFEGLHINIIDLKRDELNKIKDKGVNETAWMQLFFAIEFWLKDESKGFEKTDQFIEKSINATFDLIDSPPRKSLIDLAKFLFKEKVKSA